MPESYTAVAARIVDVSSTVKRFFLRLDGGKPLTFRAGQFLMADLPRDGKKHMRAYSIASPPHESDEVELVIKYVEGGFASRFFWKELKTGGSFPARAPFGSFVLKEPLPRNLVFVATGTGIAPLRSMIRDLYHTGRGRERKIWLFLGIRYESEILYDDEWKALAAEHDFTYVPTISRPKNWNGEVGYVQDKVKKYLEGTGDHRFYSCGGSDMVKALAAVLAEKGFDKERHQSEVW